jgi:hypothetical protein
MLAAIAREYFRDQLAQWFCLEKTRAEQSRQSLRLEQVRHLARRKHPHKCFVIGRPQECERRDQRASAGPGHYCIDQTRIVADLLFGPAGEHLGKEAVVAVRATVNGLVLVGLAEGALLGVAYVVAGDSHPVLFGFATGLLATVPFGAPLVYVVSRHRRFASAVVFIADHFVPPALIGIATRLPFLWVLLGIFGGLETFGLVGLFLGPAIMAAVLAIWREGASQRDQ